MSAPPPKANFTHLHIVKLRLYAKNSFLFYLTDLTPQPTLLTILDEGLLLLVGSVLPDQAGGPDHPAQQLQGGPGCWRGRTPVHTTVL